VEGSEEIEKGKAKKTEMVMDRRCLERVSSGEDRIELGVSLAGKGRK